MWKNIKIMSHNLHILINVCPIQVYGMYDLSCKTCDLNVKKNATKQLISLLRHNNVLEKN